MGAAPYILFYDGVCGLCNRLLRFILARDRRRRFQFAALQSDFAAETLQRFGKRSDDLDSVYLLADGRLLQKGRAILFVLRTLGLPWSLAGIFAVLPTAVIDWFYDRVARNRYRLFGRYQSCRLPTPEERGRFLGW